MCGYFELSPKMPDNSSIVTKRPGFGTIHRGHGGKGDELWSFVGSKRNQRWTWDVIKRDSGIVLAHHHGRRTDERCQQLIEKLSQFPLGHISTDNWQRYQKSIPANKHIIGKTYTWTIERKISIFERIVNAFLVRHCAFQSTKPLMSM